MRADFAKMRSKSLGTTVCLFFGAVLCGLVACERGEVPPEIPEIAVPDPASDAAALLGTVPADSAFDVGIVYELRAGMFGLTELMVAAMNGDVNAVTSLIASGADVNATDNGNSTVLMWSADSGSRDVAEVLLANGADINARDRGNSSVLIRAADKGNADLVQLLLDNGADVNVIGNTGNTALSGAVYYEHETTALLLLKSGADPNIFPEQIKSILLRAVDAEQPSVVDSLIENGVDLVAHGLPALDKAAGKGDQAIVQLLIDAGVDANGTWGTGGSSALYSAARNGDVDMVNLLVARGASVATANNRSAPLHVAAKSGHSEVVEALLLNGAPATLNDLYVALENRRSEIAQILLDQLDVDSLDRKSTDRLLITADQRGQTSIVQQLFVAAGGPRTSDASVRLLYKSSDDADCNIMLWNPREETEQLVFTSKGDCSAEFYVADNESTLFVLENNEYQVISLDNEFTSYQVELPMQQIERQLESVKEQVSTWLKSDAPDWMAAEVAAIGILESGDLGLLIHVGGPADGTNSFLYGKVGDDWVLVDEGGCGRMDNYCSFPQLNGRRIRDWSLQRTIWHPNIQRNLYFTSRSAEFDPVWGKELTGGAVQLDIDGEPLRITFKTAKGGHCADDCTFTTRLESHLEDGETMELSSNGGNSAIAGHFVLVRGDDRHSAELLDIRSGKSVLGGFSVATWVE